MNKHTQGVIDLVIKLFMAVQFRLIDNNYATGGKLREVITPEVIAAAAKKHFGPVQDMMQALRSKNPNAIRKFDDLTEFHTEFMRSLSITSGAVLNEEDGDEEAAINAQHAAFRGQASNAVYRAFKDNGFEADRIDEAMKSVFAELGQPDFINLTEFLRRTEEYLKPTPKKKTSAKRTTKADQRETFVDGDLRKIAEDASTAGESVSAAINQASVSKAA